MWQQGLLLCIVADIDVDSNLWRSTRQYHFIEGSRVMDCSRVKNLNTAIELIVIALDFINLLALVAFLPTFIFKLIIGLFI